MAWSVAYLFMSFITPLPWVKRSFIGKVSGQDDDDSAGEEDEKQKQVAAFFNKDFFS